MDRERALREDGRVFDTYDIEVEPHFVNPNYCYARGKGSREPTGKLSVLLILPFEDKTLPTFEARWDGGSREKLKEKSALDVDIIRGTPGTPSDEEINKWRGEKGDYSGHHSTEIPTVGGHAYEVRIATPTQGCIFEGVVSFALRRKLEVPVSTPTEVSVSKEVGKSISVASPVVASLTTRVIRAKI